MSPPRTPRTPLSFARPTRASLARAVSPTSFAHTEGRITPASKSKGSRGGPSSGRDTQLQARERRKRTSSVPLDRLPLRSDRSGVHRHDDGNGHGHGRQHSTSTDLPCPSRSTRPTDHQRYKPTPCPASPQTQRKPIEALLSSSSPGTTPSNQPPRRTALAPSRTVPALASSTAAHPPRSPTRPATSLSLYKTFSSLTSSTRGTVGRAGSLLGARSGGVSNKKGTSHGSDRAHRVMASPSTLASAQNTVGRSHKIPTIPPRSETGSQALANDPASPFVGTATSSRTADWLRRMGNHAFSRSKGLATTRSNTTSELYSDEAVASPARTFGSSKGPHTPGNRRLVASPINDVLARTPDQSTPRSHSRQLISGRTARSSIHVGEHFSPPHPTSGLGSPWISARTLAIEDPIDTPTDRDGGNIGDACAENSSSSPTRRVSRASVKEEVPKTRRDISMTPRPKAAHRSHIISNQMPSTPSEVARAGADRDNQDPILRRHIRRTTPDDHPANGQMSISMHIQESWRRAVYDQAAIGFSMNPAEAECLLGAECIQVYDPWGDIPTFQWFDDLFDRVKGCTRTTGTVPSVRAATIHSQLKDRNSDPDSRPSGTGHRTVGAVQNADIVLHGIRISDERVASQTDILNLAAGKACRERRHGWVSDASASPHQGPRFGTQRLDQAVMVPLKGADDADEGGEDMLTMRTPKKMRESSKKRTVIEVQKNRRIPRMKEYDFSHTAEEGYYGDETRGHANEYDCPDGVRTPNSDSSSANIATPTQLRDLSRNASLSQSLTSSQIGTPPLVIRRKSGGSSATIDSLARTLSTLSSGPSLMYAQANSCLLPVTPRDVMEEMDDLERLFEADASIVVGGAGMKDGHRSQNNSWVEQEGKSPWHHVLPLPTPGFGRPHEGLQVDDGWVHMTPVKTRPVNREANDRSMRWAKIGGHGQEAQKQVTEAEKNVENEGGKERRLRRVGTFSSIGTGSGRSSGRSLASPRGRGLGSNLSMSTVI